MPVRTTDIIPVSRVETPISRQPRFTDTIHLKTVYD